ncbi:MAG TPA: preprotein translocase subunit SecE [Acidimicrobiales bacterium]|nr:preprotein translocase subunit SecE [Acidimicrobiales bacterium]
MNRRDSDSLIEGQDEDALAVPIVTAPPTAPPLERAPRTPQGGGPVNYLREVRNELRRVAWATRDEVVNYTTVVVLTLVVLVAFVFALNYAFSKAISALFGT